MKADTRKTLQVILAIGLVVAAARLIYIYRSRHQSAAPVAQQAPPLNPTYYVVPKKLYPYDLKSARQLTRQPVWVKEGYRYFYYAYDPARHRSDFKHEAGLLGPIEKLEIKDVTTDVAPGSRNQKQVIAIFEKDGKSYSVPIGAMKGTDYQIYSDEMFFIDDPHQLYKVWPKEVWDSIENHEVKPGMDEIQASFALGMGVPQRQDDPAIKTVNYPNGGKPFEVTYRGGRAIEIKPGAAT